MPTINSIGSNNPIQIEMGGTEAATFTDHAILVGSGVAAMTAINVGTDGALLSGVTGGDPTWTTATYPTTVAIGTILVASGADTITALAPDTAGYVLTDNGVGVAPSWQSASGNNTVFHTDAGDATENADAITVTGGTNINTSGAAAAFTINLDDAITLTTVNATTFDTNVAAAGVTLSGTSLIADGTDADININITAKGTGKVIIDDLQLTTDLAVSEGGTGASTFTDHGVLTGNAANAVTATAEGATGTILTGVTGNTPTWTTATYPSTAAIGTILIASAANTITTLAPDTAGYVLTDNGAGAAPSWQAGGGATTYCSDAEAIAGTETAKAVAPSTLKAKLGTQTDHGLLVGSGTAAAITALAVGATGETIMGSTGADPTWTGSPSFSGTATAGTGISVTTGDIDVVSGSIKLPTTTATDGQLFIGGYRFFHAYGIDPDGVDTENNIFIGMNSGNFTLTPATAKRNVSIGNLSLVALTSGTANSAFGAASLLTCNSGSYNTGMGLSTLYYLTTGDYNTAISSGSLVNLTTGSYNTSIGRCGASSSGSAYTGSESSNIIFSNVGVVGESNTIRIGTQGTGDGQQDTTYIAGIYGVTPGGTVNLALVDSNGQLGSVASLGVAQGGTGAATLTDHGVLLGSGTGAVTATAEGATGTILTGVTGADPTWTTATYPATAAIGTILIASAANTITTLAPDTAGYVLTDNGAGAAPSWQANAAGGTVTSVSGGTNITASGTATDPVMDLDAALTGMTSATFATGGSLQTGTTATNSLLIQAYDVDGTAYVPFMTLTAADDPTCDLATGVTIGTKYIYRADGTDVPVADGGTGASTFTDHGVLLGSGASAITATAELSNGQLLIGSTGNDPSLATITAGTGITVTNAAGAITVASTGTTLNNQTGTTYEFLATDIGKMVTFTNGSAITVTVPVNADVAIAIGSQILCYQGGAGTVTFTPESGVTINSPGGLLDLYAQYSTCYLVKIDTNVWSLSGDLA